MAEIDLEHAAQVLYPNLARSKAAPARPPVPQEPLAPGHGEDNEAIEKQLAEIGDRYLKTHPSRAAADHEEELEPDPEDGDEPGEDFAATRKWAEEGGADNEDEDSFGEGDGEED